jgi:hypothetical protein
MKLMGAINDGGQIKMLGEVKTMDEAVEKLGITKEELNDYLSYDSDKAAIKQMIYLYKQENKLEGSSMSEDLDREFLRLWN